MAILRVVLLATAPALFWLWIFYKRDRWNKEPLAKVFKLFFLGAAVAAPAYWSELWLPGPHTLLYDNFVRVALVEEFLKLLPVWLFAYYHKEFDEPIDGIIYMVAAALGFATVENVLYALHGGERLLLYRAFTSTLAHVGFSGLVGYALGKAKFRATATGAFLLVVRAFLAVVVLHGAYDWLLAYGSDPKTPDLIARGALFVMVPALLLLLYVATNLASKASPFREPDGQAHT